MLDRAQELVSRIGFHDLDNTLATLRAANAFAEPSEARLILPPTPESASGSASAPIHPARSR